jgi:transcriptional antiterminator RfaH
MLRWYVIHTKWAGETVAESNLQRQGYEVYLPRLAQTVRRRGRLQERIVPLFPRYLFLRLHEGSQVLGPVRSTTGVTNVVRFGSSYATVPEQLIQVLQARADPETGLHRMPAPALPAPGSTIKIADGPFDGLEGVFECESGEDRAVVLLNMLGRNTRVQIPIDFILPNLAASGHR